MEPSFVHDCEVCTFLGCHKAEKGTFDLYYCGQAYLTVIARYGDNGPDYLSAGPVPLDGSDLSSPILAEAQKRAREKNLTGA